MGVARASPGLESAFKKSDFRADVIRAAEDRAGVGSLDVGGKSGMAVVRIEVFAASTMPRSFDWLPPPADDGRILCDREVGMGVTVVISFLEWGSS